MSTARINRQTYVANRLDIQFDNQSQAVGAVQNANVTMSFGLDTVSGIGDIRVKEYVPTIARISLSSDQTYLFNMEIDRLSSGGLAGQSGLLPAQAQEALTGVVFDVSAVVLNPPQTAYSTLWIASGCSLDSGNMSAAKHGTVMRQCQFQALDYKIASALTSGASGQTSNAAPAARTS